VGRARSRFRQDGTERWWYGSYRARAEGSSRFLSSKNINIDADQLLARTTGNIINPNAELLFSGVTLRKFGFSYKLVARSAGLS
jgi:hypothetical protein